MNNIQAALEILEQSNIFLESRTPGQKEYTTGSIIEQLFGIEGREKIRNIFEPTEEIQEFDDFVWRSKFDNPDDFVIFKKDNETSSYKDALMALSVGNTVEIPTKVLEI